MNCVDIYLSKQALETSIDVQSPTRISQGFPLTKNKIINILKIVIVSPLLFGPSKHKWKYCFPLPQHPPVKKYNINDNQNTTPIIFAFLWKKPDYWINTHSLNPTIFLHWMYFCWWNFSICYKESLLEARKWTSNYWSN